MIMAMPGRPKTFRYPYYQGMEGKGPFVNAKF